MATYTVNIVNSSLISKPYVLFLQPPPLSDTGASRIMTNAWAALAPPARGDWDLVTYTGESYPTWNPQAADLGRDAILGLNTSPPGAGGANMIDAFSFTWGGGPSPVATFNAAQAETPDVTAAEAPTPAEGT
jgi:hypothetical protein